MPDQKFKAPLSRLKEALKEIEPADAKTRDLLKELIGHLEAKLNTAHQAEEHQQLLKMLKENVIYFENANPVITSALEDMIGILLRMGI